MLNYQNEKDLQNSIGFKQYYGFSPGFEIEFKGKTGIYNMKDLRHIWYSLEQIKNQKAEFYVFENNENNIIRNWVLLKILSDKELTKREKIEIFLDFYCNQYITDKTHEITKIYLKQILTEIDNKNGIIRLNNLKYKQLDKIIDRIQLFIKTDKKFLKEKCNKFLDKRLRFQFKERYDHRKNLIDSDYVWGIKENKFSQNDLIQSIRFQNKKSNIQFSDSLKQENNLVIRFWEYEQFRLKGIAYAIHSSPEQHNIFNYSLLDYIDGRNKNNRNPCEVLGYWGDITIGPFYNLGLVCDDVEQFGKYYKIVNDQYYYYNEKILEERVGQFVDKFEQLNEDDLVINYIMAENFKQVQKIRKKQKFQTEVFSYDFYCQYKDDNFEFLSPQIYQETAYCYTIIEKSKKQQLHEQIKKKYKILNKNCSECKFMLFYNQLFFISSNIFISFITFLSKQLKYILISFLSFNSLIKSLIFQQKYNSSVVNSFYFYKIICFYFSIISLANQVSSIFGNKFYQSISIILKKASLTIVTYTVCKITPKTIKRPKRQKKDNHLQYLKSQKVSSTESPDIKENKIIIESFMFLTNVDQLNNIIPDTVKAIKIQINLTNISLQLIMENHITSNIIFNLVSIIIGTIDTIDNKQEQFLN